VEGVGAGLSIGAWINCQLGYGIVAEMSQPLPVPTFTISWLCLSLLRSVIGVLVLVIIRSFSKPFSIALLCRYYNSGLGYIYNRKMDPANTKSAPYGLLTCNLSNSST
jgi:hypothetical protein